MKNNKNNDYVTIDDLRPKDKDEIHKESGEPKNIVTAFSGSDNYLRTAYSFFSAAKNLASNKDKVIKNSWIYPVVYMYGFYMELSLKEMIRLGSYYEKNKGETNSSDFKKHKLEGKYTSKKGHDLVFLWNNAKKYMFIMDHEGFEKETEQLKNIESCVHELKKLYGNNGTNFKYPDELDSDININIEEIKNTMSKVENTFGGYFLGLHEKIFK